MELSKKDKTKIALIAERGWAFENIANQIVKHLNDYFDFKIVFHTDYTEDFRKILLETEDCDILHFFWREVITYLLSNNIKDFSSSKYKNKIISTAVYEHLFLSEKEIKERIELYNKTSYYVSSDKLKKIYDDIDVYKNPKMVIEDGVDPDLFYPINIERLKCGDKKHLVIGWVGNSEWGNWNGYIEDSKGFITIIEPTIKQLINTGCKIKGLYQERNKNFIPHNQMVNYYSKIDVLVCMSKTEGTPNPVLEAMACGIPIISTDVGIVTKVFGKKQKEFILEKRDRKTLTEAILKLYNNRKILWELSQENLAQINNWHWSKQCLKFKTYFQQLEKNLDNTKNNSSRQNLIVLWS